MRNSNGFHSTISRHFLRMGFFTEKQKMERGARSGGGLAPMRRTGFLSIKLCVGGAPGAPGGMPAAGPALALGSP